MKARDLKVNLAKAREVLEDNRYKWTGTTKLELLMKEMSERLRLKIRMDTGKDPANKTEWAYDKLEAAIKNHAVVPVDPAVLTKDMHELTRGTPSMRPIEDWLVRSNRTCIQSHR